MAPISTAQGTLKGPNRHRRIRIATLFGRADEFEALALERLCESIAWASRLQVQPSPGKPPNPSTAAPSGALCETGAAHVALELWEPLGIRRSLLKNLSSDAEHHERALFAMVLNHLVEPCAKLGLYDRWLETV